MENLIFEHRKRVAENIEKSFENNIEKARQVGDISSDGKKVWTEYAPGKFDWRVIKQGKATQKPTTQSDNKAEAFKRKQIKDFYDNWNKDTDMWVSKHKKYFKNILDKYGVEDFSELDDNVYDKVIKQCMKMIPAEEWQKLTVKKMTKRIVKI